MTDDDNGDEFVLVELKVSECHAPVSALDSGLQADIASRIVSLQSLDVHLDDPGAMRSDGTRGAVVNMSMHSAACPAAYTGRFADTEEDASPDRLAQLDSVHPLVYTTADPRTHLQSPSMLILRNPSCRATVDPSLVHKAVTCVLYEYPTQYISFLKEFVDALFGSKMRAFLESARIKTQALLTHTRAVKLKNALTWKMYRLLTRRPDGHDHLRDHNIRLVPAQALGSPCPAASMDECLQDHVDTYDMLLACCNGFATTDAQAHILLEYANMMGRHYCEDARLISSSNGRPSVDYDRVICRVPLNFSIGQGSMPSYIPFMGRTRAAAAVRGASCDPSIPPALSSTLDCEADEERVLLPLMDVPMGRWMGAVDTAFEVADHKRMGTSPSEAHVTGNVTADTTAVDGTRGFRWGFGHASTAMPRIQYANNVSVFSNYFTPYQIADRSRLADGARYRVSLGACTEWGAALFNRRSRWMFQTGAETDTENLVGVPRDAFQYIGEHDLQPIDKSIVRTNPKRSGCTQQQSIDTLEHRLFRHNSGVGARYAPGKTLDYRFDAREELGRCVVRKGHDFFVTQSLLLQDDLDADKDRVVSSRRRVGLYHAGTFGQHEDGFVSTEVTLPSKGLRPAGLLRLTGSGPGSIGTSDDAALEMRLCNLFMARSIGMHMCHYAWSDVCAQKQNQQRRGIRRPEEYKRLWRLETEANGGFAWKLARLLRLYAQPLGETDDRSLLYEAVRRMVHLEESADDPVTSSLRDEFPDLLPVFMPRCHVPRAPQPASGASASDRDLDTLLDRLRQTMDDVCHVLDVRAQGDETFTGCAPSRDGAAWCALYVHLRDTGERGLTQRPELGWQAEFEALRPLGLPADLLDANGLPTNPAHTRPVFDPPGAEHAAWLARRRDAAPRDRAFLLTPTETRHVDRMQALEDARQVAPPLDDETRSLDEVADADESQPVWVVIPRNWLYAPVKGSTIPGRTAAVLRAYVHTHMLPSLRCALSDDKAPLLQKIVTQPDASLDRARTVGLDGRSWSAWMHFNSSTTALTLNILRQAGLCAASRREYALARHFLFHRSVSTVDYSQLPSQRDGARRRISPEQLARHVSSTAPSYATDLRQPDVFARYFGPLATHPMEDVALQCVSITDYSMQLRAVWADVRKQHPEMWRRVSKNSNHWQSLGDLVNEVPLAVRLLAELDKTVGVTGDTASRRRAALESSEVLIMINSLTGGQLFEFAGLSRAVPEARMTDELSSTDHGEVRCRGVQDAAVPHTRVNEFHIPDDDGRMFATHTTLSRKDLERKTYPLENMQIISTSSVPSIRANSSAASSKTSAAFLNPHHEHGSLAFSMFDAAALAWHKRCYYNPSDALRCLPRPESGYQQDDMHYSIRYLVESFVHSREQWTDDESLPWELAVRTQPKRSFPSAHLGGLCRRSAQEEGADDPERRAQTQRLRRLSMLWMDLETVSGTRTWVSVPLYEQHALMRCVDLFRIDMCMPRNPWLPGDGALGTVYRHSYHSCHAGEPFGDDWRRLLRYPCPSRRRRPFSLSGGHPVPADFLAPRIHPPAEGSEAEHAERVLSRFGVVDRILLSSGLRDDEGRVQTLCSHGRVSSFLSYARRHTLLGLAGSDGTASDQQMVRNLSQYWTSTETDPELPRVMGYHREETGRLVFVAATMRCLLEKAMALNLAERIPILEEWKRMGDTARTRLTERPTNMRTSETTTVRKKRLLEARSHHT